MRSLRTASCCALLLLASVGHAQPEVDAGHPQSPDTTTRSRRLRIGVVGNEPFVIERGSSVDGLSVDVWESVANRLGVQYEYVPVYNVDAAIRRASKGELDAVIGPISITSDRANAVSFTQPYYQSALAIVARPEGGSALDKVRPFLTAAFLGGVGLFIFVLALVGTVVWLSERWDNPEQFPPQTIAGIGNGIWFALVTMTTVGYGDRVPLTPVGRFVTGAWMVLSMFLASSLTAFFATALTLSQLDRPTISTAEQLSGHRVAAVEGTTAVDFVVRHGGRPYLVEDLDQAMDSLVEKDVDAVVFDRPVLRFYLAVHREIDLALSQASYDPQGYGIALTPNSPLVPRINVELLELAESGHIRSMADRWLDRH